MIRALTTLLYRWRIVLHDLLAIPAAWLLAYWLRYNLEVIPDIFLTSAIYALPVVITVQIVVNLFMGVHRGEWRFVSLPDLSLIVRSVSIGTAAVALTLFLVADRLTYVPRSVFILYALVLLTIMAGSRLLYRLYKDRHFSTRSGRKVVIFGAGAAGEQLLRDLTRNHPNRYNIVAFLDDDPHKIGRQIHRIPVVASPDVLQDLIYRWDIDLVLIAVPSANEDQMQRLVGICEASGVEFRTLPGAHELVSGRVRLSDLREVRIDDLLGRDPVKLDWHRIKHSLCDKTVLVTGAGGSIGSELCRQLASVCSAHLVLFDQSEYNLYRIQEEMSERFPDSKITAVLGDICDSAATLNVFQRFTPAAVFHAAAYKHVPLLEGQVREVVKNNAMGTKNIADLAHKFGAEKFVLISTDKAVNPSSLMGACKRVAEIYCQQLASQSQTKFITVRFGNVLGSAGSVVPKFQKQIKKGGPVTVTHPEMTRYFMTITEATQLILEASAMGEDGRIYVLEMGQPVLISELAEKLVRLSGMEPHEDIKIVYTGLRKGEKLHEELFHTDESLSDTEYEKIQLAATRFVEPDKVNAVFDQIQIKLDTFDESLSHCLEELVPEYSSIAKVTKQLSA
ncbi:nucleoside-diphosphate sugar epimerase/dehydratase [Arenicella sp. 4NH20-0111]|uniref:polysaccharide biosynthesis protein n=1 Tax=Arenicella sp. 4NH20-0111 TaxID=3127648 RepID=UPI00333F5361